MADLETDDLDDTVIVPPRAPVTQPEASDDEATVIVPRPVARRIDHATGEPIDDGVQTTEEIPPLRFYALRVGSGTDPIILDAPCYVGRNPSAPRVVSGLPPRLVRVPSPLREVSGSHVEVRQLGSTVIVTDLKSTNGSIVMVPGSVPRKLRQGESVVVSPGTLVDIGDDNILQILPMQRPA
ncbi:MAG: FHA domain-containing protein [Rhodoglobus sp.]